MMRPLRVKLKSIPKDELVYVSQRWSRVTSSTDERKKRSIVVKEEEELRSRSVGFVEISLCCSRVEAVATKPTATLGPLSLTLVRPRQRPLF